VTVGVGFGVTVVVGVGVTVVVVVGVGFGVTVVVVVGEGVTVVVVVGVGVTVGVIVGVGVTVGVIVVVGVVRQLSPGSTFVDVIRVLLGTQVLELMTDITRSTDTPGCNPNRVTVLPADDKAASPASFHSQVVLDKLVPPALRQVATAFEAPALRPTVLLTVSAAFMRTHSLYVPLAVTGKLVFVAVPSPVAGVHDAA